jgi:hypothetical protein
MYWNRRLTRLELALYALIAAILVVFLLERMLQLFEIAERTSVETTVMAVNSAINYRAAAELVRGSRARNWEGRNPFQLAELAVPNFLDGGLASMRPGSWVFDEASGEAVYLPRFNNGLAIASKDGALRFRIAHSPAEGTYMLVPTSELRGQ